MGKMQCENSRKMKQPETNKGPMEVFELSQRVSSDATLGCPNLLFHRTTINQMNMTIVVLSF